MKVFRSFHSKQRSSDILFRILTIRSISIRALSKLTINIQMRYFFSTLTPASSITATLRIARPFPAVSQTPTRFIAVLKSPHRENTVTRYILMNNRGNYSAKSKKSAKSHRRRRAVTKTIAFFHVAHSFEAH